MTYPPGASKDVAGAPAPPTRQRGAMRRAVAFFDPAEAGFLRRMASLAAAFGAVVACTVAAAMLAFARTPTGKYWTTVALLESGQLARAEGAARRLASDPATRTYGSYRLLTTALRREGKVDEQLAAFDEAVRAFPDVDLSHGHRCWYYSLYGRAVGAMDSCDRAVELASPQNAGKIHFYRSAARYLAGDTTGAIEDLRAAESAWRAGAIITTDYEATAARWLQALQAGQSILDEPELERLRGWF